MVCAYFKSLRKPAEAKVIRLRAAPSGVLYRKSNDTTIAHKGREPRSIRKGKSNVLWFCDLAMNMR